MRRLILFIIVVIASLLLVESVFGIGVTPPRIILDDALKGSSIEQSVSLIDVNSGDRVTISLSGEGSDWVSLPNGNEFIIEDESQTISFILNVPEKAPNGDYKVLAQVVVNPSLTRDSGENTASIISGIMVELLFTVTGEEEKKYSIRQVSIPNIEVGMPLTVVTTIKNEGNVIASPSKIDITIKDKEKSKIVFSDSADVTGGVDPFNTGETTAIFRVDLSEDLYFADVVVQTYSGEVIENDIPFDIFPRGTLASSGELVEVFVQDNVKDLAKITAVFSNTGSIALHSTVTFELYNDGSLLDVITTEEQYVGTGETQEFVAHYSPPKKGTYEVQAYATFSGKKSNTQSIEFFASPSHSGIANTTTYVVIVVILVSFLVFFASTKLRKREREDAIW